jgi:hypothetical protein
MNGQKPSLNVQDHIDRIDRELAIIHHLRQRDLQAQRSMRLAPWQVMIAGMIAGAAFFAACVVFVKLIGDP